MEGIKWDGDGLIPVVVQDEGTRDVVMVADTNAEAFELTLKTGKAHYYSRSRESPGSKGRPPATFRRSAVSTSTAMRTRSCSPSTRRWLPATRVSGAAFIGLGKTAGNRTGKKVFDEKAVYSDKG